MDDNNPLSPDPPRVTRVQVLPLVRWLALVAVVFVVVAAGMRWIDRSRGGAAPAGATTADPLLMADGTPYPAPDFRLASLDGRTLGPPDFAGDVVLVEFWATWCGPCRLQAKFLDQVHEEYEDDGVQFLALDVGETEEKVRAYVDKTPFPYPVLLDPDDVISQRYQVLGLPTVMIIDRQGRITYMETGVTPVSKLRRELDAAGAAA